MKWLIYLLLLVNIGFFAWHFRGLPGKAVVADEEQVLGVTRLVLLREQQQQAVQEQHWCYSLGPFEKQELSVPVAEKLTGWQIQAWQRQSKEARRKGYWVLLQPMASRQEARAAVEKLKAKGIKDYFLIATGDKANGVSLGVFSMFESAHRRIEHMKKLGFEPALEEVKLPAIEYWLDWRREAERSLSPEQLAELRRSFNKGLQQIERPCQPPEQPGPAGKPKT